MFRILRSTRVLLSAAEESAEDFTALLFKRDTRVVLVLRAPRCTLQHQRNMVYDTRGRVLAAIATSHWRGPVVDFLKQMVSRHNFCGGARQKAGARQTEAQTFDHSQRHWTEEIPRSALIKQYVVRITCL
jgi:capsid protein